MTEEKKLQILFTEIQHNCSNSSQLLCCEKLRCEVCHVSHLKEVHGAQSLSLFWKFHTSSWLIKGKEIKVSKSVVRKKLEEKIIKRENLSGIDKIVSKLSREEFTKFLLSRGIEIE